MRRRRGLILFGIMLCLCLGTSIVVSHFINSGMKRVSSHLIQGNKASRNETFELPDLKVGQLVVIEADQNCKARSCIIRHFSTETFAIESQPFINGRMEYEIHEDADYRFHLNCESEEFCISISIWESYNPSGR